jgi:hypothetical protein
MSIPNKIFLHYITETASGKCFYINAAGNVDKSNDLKYFLDQSPEGWFDSQVAFGRNAKYFGLNRTFTIPLKFNGDGASIVRYHLYKGKGIEAPLTYIVLKWNPDNDTFELYYKGELDLTKAVDSAEGISVNIMEGGIVKLLKSYENTVFEFPLDGSIPENILVNIDGLKLTDTFFYQVNDFDITYLSIGHIKLGALSAAFINNIGDNVGIEKGTQGFEDIVFGQLNEYTASSANYLFGTAYPLTIRLHGQFSFQWIKAPNAQFFFRTSKGQGFSIFSGAIPNGQTKTIDFDFTINLAADEKIFLIYDLTSGLTTSHVHVLQTSFQIDFTSRIPATKCWGLTARDLFKLLVQKIGGGLYLSQSTLLDQWLNFAVTSGFALRGDPKAVLKTSLADFWETFNPILNASLSNIPNLGGNDVVFFESKKFVYDPSTTNISLGEVSNLKISIAEDYFFNKMKIGYPPQTYDEKSGQSEWNTTFQWQSPITRENKSLELVTKYRADAYGIEFVRFLFGGKSTTNNSADNDVFILNVDRTTPVLKSYSVYQNNPSDYNLPSNIVADSITGDNFTTTDNEQYTYTGTAQQVRIGFSISVTKTDASDYIIKIYQNATVIYSKSFPGDGTTNGDYVDVILNPGDVLKYVIDYAGTGVLLATVDHAGFTVTFTSQAIYNLKRKTYDAISGIPNSDAAYNIEDLTPKRMLERWYNYLKSTLFNLLPGKVSFLTCDKNPLLSTTLSGKTITENADVPISSMDDPLFYPFVFEFDTTVPLNFIDIYNAAANGHISFKFNSKTFYGFSIEVKAKPALNEAQSWKLLCSPKTNLSDLLSLDIDGLNFLDMASNTLFASHLSPLKWVQLGASFPAQYHFKHMDSDWFVEQIKFWANRKGYNQPWQKNDTIFPQFISNALGPVQIQILDSTGKNVGAPISIAQIASTAIASPKMLFQQAMTNHSSLADGIYFFLVTAGTGGVQVQYITEPLNIKTDHLMTLLFEYSHRTNKQSTLFHPVADGSADYTPSFRVEGWIGDFTPDAKFSTYEDEPANLEMENGFAFRRFKLHLAINDGLPDWVIDKVNRMLLLSTCKIDGFAYTRDADAKWEVTQVNGSPKKYWTIDIREAKASEGITVNTDGQQDENITVVYNINTKAFGQSDSTVQVTKVE